MEASVNRKMANKAIVIVSVMVFIGLGVLNTFDNMPLGETNKKADKNVKVSTNAKIDPADRKVINVKVSVNKDKQLIKPKKTSIYVKSNNKIVKKISAKKNSNIAMSNKRLSSRGGYGNLNYSSELYMEATAYTSSYADTGKNPGDSAFGITATGTRAKVGTVAVDPNVIPLGSKLYIKSTDGQKDYGYAVAEDTGGAIKNAKIDLYFNTEYDAIQFGRRKVKVYILR